MVRAYVYAGLVIPLCAVAGIVACSDPANTSLPDLAPSPGGTVEQLFANRCALSGCHGDSGTPAEGLVLTASVALRNTVNVAAMQDPARKLISPGQPAESYLFCKVDPSCAKIVGSHMPIGNALSAVELELLRSFILSGAGGVNDGGAPPPADMTVVDTTAPTFAGVTAAAPAPNSVTLSWSAGSDNVSLPADLKYLIYQASTAGGQSFAAPTYVTTPGATNYVVGKLATSTRYYFVVRAQDQAGNIDTNRLEQSALTPAQGDTMAPTFAGLGSATASGNSITLSWTAATDVVTPQAQLVYHIYQASSAGGENYATPTFTTSPGAVQYVVSGLSTGMTYYFVVRAQDQAGNISINTVERSAVTQAPSLATQVQPIFTKSCGGGGCHAGASPAQGLDLSAGKSFGSLVNIASAQCPTVKRVLPSTPSMSYLIHKLQGAGPCFLGTRMPKGQPLAAVDINTISAWIAAGAPNN